jgi:hypothetical protein
VSRLLSFVKRWGISLYSLIAGILALFILRRGLPRLSLIVGYLLLLWLLVAVLVQVRDVLQSSEKRSAHLVLTATEYTIQTLYHGVLLFLLPAYWAATTLVSPNVFFLLLLIGLTLLATIDPWYQAIVHPRPWFSYVFFLASMFGALNLALPLIGVPPFLSLLIAAWLSVVLLTPAVCRARGWRWIHGLAATCLVGLVVAGAVGLRPIVVPPAPLFLARAALGWTVGTLDSLEPIPGAAIKAADLQEKGLVAHTAIYAPAGLRQPVEHVWRQDGRIISVVRLTPVQGGRQEGYRTFSRKSAFPANPVGRWVVDVMTESGQLIGRLRFRVVP